MSHVKATFAIAKPVPAAVDRKCLEESRFPRGMPQVSANMHSTVWTSLRSRNSLAASAFACASATVISLPLVGGTKGGYRSAQAGKLQLTSDEGTGGSMRAVVLRSFHAPLEVEDRPVPTAS